MNSAHINSDRPNSCVIGQLCLEHMLIASIEHVIQVQQIKRSYAAICIYAFEANHVSFVSGPSQIYCQYIAHVVIKKVLQIMRHTII